MNTKKVVFGLLTCLLFVGVSCTSSVAHDDSVYENGVDRTKITTGNKKKSVDRTKITTSNKKSVDRTKITTSNKKSS